MSLVLISWGALFKNAYRAGDIAQKNILSRVKETPGFDPQNHGKQTKNKKITC